MRPKNPAVREVQYLISKALIRPFRFRCGGQIMSAPLSAAHVVPRVPGEYEIFLYSRERPILGPRVSFVDRSGAEVEAQATVQPMGVAYRIVLRARVPK